MLGKLVCWITRKHKRGRRLKPADPPHLPTEDGKEWPANLHRYQCPRCKATWTRPAKVKA